MQQRPNQVGTPDPSDPGRPPDDAGSAAQSPYPAPGGAHTPAPDGTEIAFEAENATLTAPFVVDKAMVWQTVSTTDPQQGGRLVQPFEVSVAGDYLVSCDVVAETDGSNSFFVNIDADPLDGSMVWDITELTTDQAQARVVSWRGTGSPESPEYPIKVFALKAGSHELIIRGREPGARIDRCRIAPVDRGAQGSGAGSERPLEPPTEPRRDDPGEAWVPPSDAGKTVAGCDDLVPGQLGVGRSISVRVPVVAENPGSVHADFNWSFNSGGADAYCGKFANGDYWIAPKDATSVQITALTTNDGNITADADPIPEATGIMATASKSYGNRDTSQNIVAQLPVSYAAITSIVAAKQRNEAATSSCRTSAIKGACVDAYHVVTVLPRVPPNNGGDMIRPNVTGQTKVTLKLSDFDFSRVPSSAILAGADAAAIETMRQRWSHTMGIFNLRFPDGGDHGSYGEANRAWRPHIVHSNYGAGWTKSYFEDLFRLFSSSTPARHKVPALAAMISFGLDTYHARYHGPADKPRGWNSGAGQHLGPFPAVAFMAALLKDPSYATVLKKVGPTTHADDALAQGPQELRQINIGPEGALVWGDVGSSSSPSSKPSALEERYYWTRFFGAQCYDGAPGGCKLGSASSRDPYGYIDGGERAPGTGYAEIALPIIRGLGAATCLMPELKAVVNYPQLIPFLDRVTEHGVQALPDPCARPPANENRDCEPWGNDGKGENCKYFRVSWGPDPKRPGHCIRGNGRFPSHDGRPFQPTGGYAIGPVEAHWAAIRALCK